MRWQLWTAVGLIVLLIGLWGSNSLSQMTPAPTPTANPITAAACADARDKVLAYQPPGAPARLVVTLGLGLAEAGEGGSGTWDTPRADSSKCIVTYRTTLRGTPTTLAWRWDLATERAEAADSTTRRISGW